ncbi:MAG: ABC transporter permease [Candidatus Moranbacteria bacterium]|nr:ABC transporter permease [Candidatus Moranbacteria bacterium]
MIENVFVSIPFIAILIIKNATLESSLLLVGTIVLASFSFKTAFHIMIPTPFSNHSFEFTVGFRKSFLIFIFAYTLAIIAISVDNLNLGVFAMLLVYLTALSYYAKPENEFYVWVHADTPKSFIYKKLKVAARNVFILNLPILMGLLIFYPNEFSLIILFYFIGQFFLWTLILAKYSAYPQEISLPEGFLLAFSIYFPPLLIALMPFFYSKSINKLKMILYDKN